jgi:peptidoglycan/LPS O-acetylase OafA/YrhL
VRDAAGQGSGRSFRPDIEGLRAVAVLLVVTFHAGLGPVQGGFVGVDVFFVISGFLITGLLVAELERDGSVSLTRFYARRVRRLLPAASLVLVAVLVFFRTLLAPIDWPGLGREILAAAVWMANWQFASASTDYMNAVDHSPVLHYWSLSVEEQFYLVWPLLILLFAGRRRTPWPRRRRRLIVVLFLIGAGSLTTSILTTVDAGPWAYFGLHTRAWELAVGGLLALLLPALSRLHKGAAVTLGILGVTGIIAAVLLLDRNTPFPGSAAVLPVAGAALVLLAGAPGQFGIARVLGLRPLTYIGRLSYAWYLWHWPVLIALQITAIGTAPDEEFQDFEVGPSTAQVLIAVLLSFLLAALTHRLVEDPVRHARPLASSRRLSLAFGVGLLVMVAILPPTLLRPPNTSTAALSSMPLAEETAGNPVSGYPRPGTRTATMTPQQARDDNDTIPGCFLGFAGDAPTGECLFGDQNGDRTVVLFGDSHAMHWSPALKQIAQEQGWRLFLFAKSGCGYSAADQWLSSYKRFYTECGTWRDNVIDRISELGPVDAVIIGRNYAQTSKMTSADGTRLPSVEAERQWVDGAEETIRDLSALATTVILLRDTPHPREDVPACLSGSPGQPESCAYTRHDGVALDTKLFTAEKPMLDRTGVIVLDPTDLVCDTDPCSVLTRKGTIVFRDGHHLTATFSAEVANGLAALLVPAITTG